jgi:polysaccharide pyruvyl transferase WcaK-like protein
MSILPHMITAGSSVIRGYYGMSNAGDDTFLLVSAWATEKFLRCKNIYATATSVPCPAKYNIRPIYTINFQKGIRHWQLAQDIFRTQNAEAVVFGGGSTLHSSCIMDYHTRVLEHGRRGKHFAAGISIGPFGDAGAEAACGRLLKSLDYVGVRDRESYRRAKAMGIDSGVELTFDIAPLILKADPLLRQSLQNVRRRPKSLGIALCNYEKHHGGDESLATRRLDAVATAALHCYLAGTIDQVILIDMCGHALYGDCEVSLELSNRLDSRIPVKHIPYRDNPSETMLTIRRLGGLLAMRMHASVFGFCAEVPTVNLSYHEKCSEWAKMIGHPSGLVADAASVTGEELQYKLTRLFKDADVMPRMSVDEAIERSARNWDWIESRATFPKIIDSKLEQVGKLRGDQFALHY